MIWTLEKKENFFKENFEEIDMRRPFPGKYLLKNRYSSNRVRNIHVTCLN